MHKRIHIQEGSVAAQHGGISPGDTLVSIDKEDLSGKPLQAVARAMMAPPGVASQVNMCVWERVVGGGMGGWVGLQKLITYLDIRNGYKGGT